MSHGDRVAGVDEAGRGPLAGPVVAAAVILDPLRPVAGLRDSKQLSAAQRERLALSIRERAIAWSVAEAEHAEIDHVNILEATMRAMARALAGLAIAPTHVIVDGNKLPQCPDLPADCRLEARVRADASVPEVSAASILAKTWRDARMAEYDRLYPGYGFARHQGYPTAAHVAALARLGPSPIHRRSFAPVRSLLP